MKNLLGVLLFSIVSIVPALGQHTLILKTGERLDGALIKADSLKILFVFKGNRLSFEIDDLEAIYFSDKVLLTSGQESADCYISGVVTYYFNENYGYKPDVGAEVFVVPIDSEPNFDQLLLSEYHLGVSARALCTIYRAKGMKPPANTLEQLERIGAETDKKWEELDHKAYDVCRALKNNHSVVQTSADGNGSFRTKVRPGKYYVLVVSKHRNRPTLTEYEGKIFIDEIEIKAGEEKNIPAEFDAH
jgi:hypothetical protein